MQFIQKHQKIPFLKQYTSLRQTQYFNFATKPISKNQTHYEILKVKRSSKIKDIKKAYFDLAKTCHPDLFPGDKIAEENFKLLSEAYETLKDPAKRQIYDLGQQNPHFAQDANAEDFQKYYDSDFVKNHQDKKYYENRWYEYKPHKDRNNLRDEYYQEATKWDNQETKAWKNILIRIGIVAGIWLFVDLYRFSSQSKHSSFIKRQKEILAQARKDNEKEIEIEEDFKIPLNYYIDIRTEQKQEEESGIGFSNMSFKV